MQQTQLRQETLMGLGVGRDAGVPSGDDHPDQKGNARGASVLLGTAVHVCAA
jgi:hypothetical protein